MTLVIDEKPRHKNGHKVWFLISTPIIDEKDKGALGMPSILLREKKQKKT